MIPALLCWTHLIVFLAELSVMFFGLRWDLFVFPDVQRAKMNNLCFPALVFPKASAAQRS